MPEVQEESRTCRCNRSMVRVRLVGAKVSAWWCERCDGEAGHRLVKVEEL